MEVVEDDGHVVDPWSSVSLTQRVVGDVPGREAPADVLEDLDAFEALGPVVEVHLVAELPVLEAVVAPLEAPLAPPLERRRPRLVIAEREPFDVVDAARRVSGGGTPARSDAARSGSSRRRVPRTAAPDSRRSRRRRRRR